MKHNIDDELPPLEDFSDELSKRRGNTQKEPEAIKVNVVGEGQKKEVPKEEFGMKFKRGFFLKNNDKKGQNENPEDLTHIKSAQSSEGTKTETYDNFKSNLKNSSNQTSSNPLLSNIVDKKDEWMNQELLNKLAQKPNLIKYFMDPRFTEVINLMQKDPKRAIEQYGKIPEFNEFIKEFSGIMAEHFNKMSKNEENKPSNVNIDQESQLILQDPKVQPIIYKLQTEGKLDVAALGRDPYVAERIKKLIDKGVLKFQRESELNK